MAEICDGVRITITKLFDDTMVAVDMPDIGFSVKCD
jgi:hypothetical protein